MNIRFAKTEDCTALLKIYNQYIDTPITFEYASPTVSDFTKRIELISCEYPYLICEIDGHAAGYAYAHRYKERAAYQWSAELSVYLDKAFTSIGLGKKFYTILIEILKLQRIKTVYGVVTVPNIGSEKLHESLGFDRIGTYHNAGYKCGQWHNLACFEKNIAPYEPNPAPFQQINRISAKRLEAMLRTIN